MNTCARCGAQVYWATNRSTGKVAPIDAEPDPKGNVILHDDWTYSVLGKNGNLDDGPTRMNHFVTCSDPPRRRP